MISQTQFKQFSLQCQHEFAKYFAQIESLFYRQDPIEFDDHIEYETYYQLTRFDQAYIINERNMKTPVCKVTCSEIKHSSYDNCDMPHMTTCANTRPCKNFYDCQSTASKVYVCTSKQPSSHFYEYYQIGGERKHCSGTLSVGQYFEPHDSPYDCEMCLCYCDQADDDSDRIVSLQEQVSNTFVNEVVTGMRIVKIEQIFYVQIQVGKLLPRKLIQQNSTRWVPLEKVTGFDYTRNRYDYLILRRDTHFDMDVITLNENEVVTGNLTVI